MERMIRGIWIIAFIGVMSAHFGCGQRSANLQRGVAPPDKTLYETGKTYLDRGHYIRARLAFQTLLNTYPESDLASDAYFAIGDTFYDEGGTENLLMAENQYKDFMLFFAGDPRAADAQMKIISLNHSLMRAPDRDPQYALRTLQEIETFERRFSGHDYLPIVQRLRVGVEDNLARNDLGIGEFYLRRGNSLGAIQRFQHITENYQNFEDMDTVLFRIAELHERVLRDPGSEFAELAAAEAANWYGRIAEGFPFSRHYETAKRRLIELGFEIPEVNETLAAANQANIRPSEGFSPLRPLIDFGKALGFIAAPDLYEVARRTVEEERAQAAAEGAGAGDDIQIESEILRSASGESPDATYDSPAVSPGDANPSEVEQQNKPSRYQRKPQQR